MQKKLIECVPNFSEGRDLAVIKQITDVIEKVEGIKLLDVDPGEATNRTVVTFVGEPEPVMEDDEFEEFDGVEITIKYDGTNLDIGGNVDMNLAVNIDAVYGAVDALFGLLGIDLND